MCDAQMLCLDALGAGPWAIAFEIVLFAQAFVGIAVVADNHLCVALETLCMRWAIPEDVAGASFLALGGAAPEIVINMVSTAKGVLAHSNGDQHGEEAANSLGISSIIGSGMLAFTLIPGLCAVACSKALSLTRRPLARDAGAYLISLFSLLAILDDGLVEFHEALALLVLFVIYLAIIAGARSIRAAWRTPVWPASLEAKLVTSEGDSAAVLRTVAEGTDEKADNESAEQPNGENPEAANGETGEDEQDEDDEEPTSWWRIARVPFTPLMYAMERTCPECEADSDTASLYPITLCAALAWLALLSFVISAVVTRWAQMAGISNAVMGCYIVAVGAQVPDTVQAVAIARKGHGSMAIASATGSQVINVLIGLGLPWIISTSASLPVYVRGYEKLQLMGCFQAVCVGFYLLILLVPTIPTWGGPGRAMLGRKKGLLLLIAYVFVAAALYAEAGRLDRS